MAVTTKWYPKGLSAFVNKEVDWNTDTNIKVAVMGTGFTFDDAHDYWNDVSANDYGSATGYTAGGVNIATRAIVQTDSAALTARANTTAYVVGDIVRTATDSTRCLLCVVAGTSGGSEPAGLATLGSFRELTDTNPVWVNIGRAITSLDGDAVVWTGLDETGTPGAVIYMDTGTPTTSPLLGHIDFGATETPTALTITPPVEGYLWLSGGAAL
jgi:hypothetical protein